MTTKMQEKQLRDLYELAFPKEEKKPFSIIMQKQKEGIVEILCIEDNAIDNEEPIFLGLAITILYKDYVLLDYFAIEPSQRGSGVGSQVIKLLRERYSQKNIFLEIENTTPIFQKVSQEELAIRNRRKAFYMRNGLTPMDYYIDLFGVEMIIMVFDKPITFEIYRELYEKTFSTKFIKNVKLIEQ